MTLTAKHRSSIYSTLSPLIGEEEAEALLSEFPAREVDEPATKDFVRAEVAAVRTDIAELEARMNEKFRQMTIWVTTVMAAMTTTQIAAVALFT